MGKNEEKGRSHKSKKMYHDLPELAFGYVTELDFFDGDCFPGGPIKSTYIHDQSISVHRVGERTHGIPGQTRLCQGNPRVAGRLDVIGAFCDENHWGLT